MTKDQLPAFDAKLSGIIKSLQEDAPKDNPHAYTQDIREIIEDLYRLQDRVREDWR